MLQAPLRMMVGAAVGALLLLLLLLLLVLAPVLVLVLVLALVVSVAMAMEMAAAAGARAVREAVTRSGMRWRRGSALLTSIGALESPKCRALCWTGPSASCTGCRRATRPKLAS